MKCCNCNKKLNLAKSISGMCKCNKHFCQNHIINHDCNYDYKTEYAKTLNKIKIEFEKVKIF